jgi:hypothetical protein
MLSIFHNKKEALPKGLNLFLNIIILTQAVDHSTVPPGHCDSKHVETQMLGMCHPQPNAKMGSGNEHHIPALHTEL